MKIDIDKETADLLIQAITTSNLPVKRLLGPFVKLLKTIE